MPGLPFEVTTAGPNASLPDLSDQTDKIALIKRFQDIVTRVGNLEYRATNLEKAKPLFLFTNAAGGGTRNLLGPTGGDLGFGSFTFLQGPSTSGYGMATTNSIGVGTLLSQGVTWLQFYSQHYVSNALYTANTNVAQDETAQFNVAATSGLIAFTPSPGIRTPGRKFGVTCYQGATSSGGYVDVFPAASAGGWLLSSAPYYQRVRHNGECVRYISVYAGASSLYRWDLYSYTPPSNPIYTVSGSQNVKAGGVYYCDATGGAITLTFEEARLSVPGFITVIKSDSSGNAVNVTASGTETIRSAGGTSISSQYGSMTFQALTSGNFISSLYWWHLVSKV